MSPQSSDVEVGIVGIKALAKDIKHLSEDQQGPLFKAIREAGLRAVEPVASRTRSDVPHVEVEDQKGYLARNGARIGNTNRRGRLYGFQVGRPVGRMG